MKIKEYYEPIGKYVVHFSQLEFAIQMQMCGLMRIPPDFTMALTSEMSFARRLDALVCLCRLLTKDEALMDDVNKFAAYMSEVEKRRNLIVHTCWTSFGEQSLARMKPTAKRKNGVQTNFRNASLTDLDADFKHLNDGFTQLLELNKKLVSNGLSVVDLSAKPKATPTPNPVV